MSTWLRNVRTGSFRRSVKFRQPSPCHLTEEDVCSVIQNVNAECGRMECPTAPPPSTAAAPFAEPHKAVNPHQESSSTGSLGTPPPVNGHHHHHHPLYTGTAGRAGDFVSASPAASSAGMPSTDKCERHPGRQSAPAPYYCLQCQALACQVCLDESTHYGHGLKLLREAAELQQHDLQDKLAMLALRLDSLKLRQDQMDMFEMSYAETRRSIQETAKELVARIAEHEQRLLKEADDIHETTYKKFGFRKEELDQNVLTLDILRRRAQTVVDNNTLVKDSPAQFLHCHRNVAEKLSSFEHLFPQQDPKAPVMTFSPIRCNTSFGMVETTEQDTPQQSRKKRLSVQHRSISLPSSPQPSTGKKTVGFTRAFQQHPANHPAVGSPLLGGPSSHTRNVLHARDFSHLLHGSDPSSPVSSPSDHLDRPLSKKESMADSYKPAKCLWKITQEGSGPGEINCPNDVAFLFDGSIVVADRDNNRIQIFDSQGNFVKTIVAPKFKPRRISITKDGNIAVTDAAENCVKVFDLSGQCVISWGKKWYKNIFKSPCGITVNHLQQPIVSDMERHTVTIYNMEGKLIRHLQCDTNQDFHSPAYITTDSHDRIIVADNWQQCVKVFDDLGKFHFQFNRTGKDDACLEYPNGVCADSKDNIYVADWGTHSVAKFTRDGEFVSYILTREDGLYHPAGIATMDNFLAVTAYCDSQSSVALYTME